MGPSVSTAHPLSIQREDETGVIIANDADAERCFELLPLITRKVWCPHPSNQCKLNVERLPIAIELELIGSFI